MIHTPQIRNTHRAYYARERYGATLRVAGQRGQRASSGIDHMRADMFYRPSKEMFKFLQDVNSNKIILLETNASDSENIP